MRGAWKLESGFAHLRRICLDFPLLGGDKDGSARDGPFVRRQSSVIMSFVCDICAKKPSRGNTVSHANNKRRRIWNPNLQNVRVLKDGRVQRIRVCTQCIRSGKIVKAPYDHSGAKARREEAASS